MKMQLKTVLTGPLEVNCHLVRNSSTGQGLIFDPGDDGRMIVEQVQQFNMRPLAVLLTHAHVDHIRGVGEVAAAFSCPVWLHPDDHSLYHSPANALPPWLEAAENLPPPCPEVPPKALDTGISILHTPGHSPGSCCFYFCREQILFSGDTLFAGSIGRTDLPGGDQQTLLQSIRRQIMPLPAATRVFAGHGPATTIDLERKSNPFLGC